MMDENTARAVDEMVRRLVEQFDPEQIVLFGSQARGDARWDSDVDLLVIMPFTGSKREKRIQMRVALHDLRVPIDIVLATPEEVRKYGHLWERLFVRLYAKARCFICKLSERIGGQDANGLSGRTLSVLL